MRDLTLTETCGCGSKFTMTIDRVFALTATKAAETWRTGHRHSESVGICADQPPAIRVGDTEVQQAHCELKAGHAGAHSNGQGHWKHADRIDWSRLNYGICPKCGEDKFIGHGPLCGDCYARAHGTAPGDEIEGETDE